MMSIILVMLVAFLRLQSVVSSSNQTFLFGYTSRGIEIGNNYKQSLFNLLATFSSQASNTVFYNSSTFGQTPYDQQLSGLFFCRGDIGQQECCDCVNYAKQKLLTEQPFGKEAMAWYDHCMIRYSNKPFLGKLDYTSWLSTWNTNANVTSHRSLFIRTLRNTMKVLSIRAAYGRSAKKFATRVVRFAGEESLYALVQCTPDLNENDCYGCLTNAMGGLRRMGYSNGGKVMRLNCMVRYETFPFFYSNEIKFLPTSQSPGATNSMLVRLRVQLNSVPVDKNSTNISASSVMKNDPTSTRNRAKLLIPPSSIKAMKIKLLCPSEAIANSTVFEVEGFDEADNKATEK